MSPPLPVGCDVVDEMITVSNVKLSAAIDRHVHLHKQLPTKVVFTASWLHAMMRGIFVVA